MTSQRSADKPQDDKSASSPRTKKRRTKDKLQQQRTRTKTRNGQPKTILLDPLYSFDLSGQGHWTHVELARRLGVLPDKVMTAIREKFISCIRGWYNKQPIYYVSQTQALRFAKHHGYEISKLFTNSKSTDNFIAKLVAQMAPSRRLAKTKRNEDHVFPSICKGDHQDVITRHHFTPQIALLWELQALRHSPTTALIARRLCLVSSFTTVNSKSKNEIPFTISHKNIAAICNCSTATVQRGLDFLEKKGLISTTRNGRYAASISVLNYKPLNTESYENEKRAASESAASAEPTESKMRKFK